MESDRELEVKEIFADEINRLIEQYAREVLGQNGRSWDDRLTSWEVIKRFHKAMMDCEAVPSHTHIIIELCRLMIVIEGGPDHPVHEDFDYARTRNAKVEALAHLATQEWKTEHWDHVKRWIGKCHNAVAHQKDEDEGTARSPPRAADANRYARIIEMIHIQRVMCHIRPQLEEKTKEKNFVGDGVRPTINKEAMSEFRTQLEKEDKHLQQKICDQLMEADGTFRSLGALHKVFGDGLLSLDSFVSGLWVLVRSWFCDICSEPSSAMAFGNARHNTHTASNITTDEEGDRGERDELFPAEDSQDEETHAEDEEDKGMEETSEEAHPRQPSRTNERSIVRNSAKRSGDRDNVRQLRVAREELNNQVEDPLSESINIASQAKAHSATVHIDAHDNNDGSNSPSKNRNSTRKEQSSARSPSKLYTKKRTATAIAFDDVESDDEDGAGVHEQQEEKHAERQKRRRWSQEEKDAVKEGAKMFQNSTTRWSDTKHEFYDILQYRTNVQIKDCYRTISRSNKNSPKFE
uniref:Myb-like domain-containing protein n=1 Tax=Craspedostauros australis TaxID=1486917 RepID=A0A7R9WN38_9STRA